MKFTEQEKKYLIALGVIAVVAALYFFGYRPFIAKVEALEVEVQGMQARVDTYAATLQTKEFYQAEAAHLKREIEVIDKSLPQALEQESVIEVMDTLSKTLKVNLPTIELGKNEETYLVAGVAQSADTSADAAVPEDSFKALKTTVNTATVCDYETFKKLLQYVEDYPTQIALDGIAVQNGETGLMVGLTMHFYGLHVPGREETYVSLGAYQEGKENIFSHDTMTGAGLIQNSDQMVYEDLFLTADPMASDSMAITIGSANDHDRKTYLYEETNAPTKVTVHLTQEGEKYYATYELGNQRYPAHGGKLQLAPSDGIGMEVYCTPRMGTDDLNGALLDINNETDKTAYIYIRNDDAANPRFALAQSKGDIRVVNK